MSKLCQKCSQVWAAPNNLYCTSCHFNKRIDELEAENIKLEYTNKGLVEWAHKHNAEMDAENNALREAILTWWNAEQDEDGYAVADNNLGQVAKELVEL